MQINGELISEEEVVELLPTIYDLCKQHDIPATFFEVTTALAFAFFRKADVVVLETGLGGRLDATNVIRSPAVSVITSIGLEHTRILGDTVEKIAVEKGGIIKPDRPVLVGPNVPHNVLRQCAQEKGASEYFLCEDVLGPSPVPITDYDEENARTAQAALSLLQRSHGKQIGSIIDSVIQSGTQTRPPCRFEIVQVTKGTDGDTLTTDTTSSLLTVVLDVAHNPPAMEYLAAKLKSTFPGKAFRFVVGMSSDKDLRHSANILLDTAAGVDSIHLVQAAHPRAAKLEDIIAAEPLLKSSHYDTADRSISRQIALARTLAAASSTDEILVVCGSVFLMAEARECLGFDEPRDSDCIAEVAGAHLRHGQEMFGNTDPPESDDDDDDNGKDGVNNK